MRARPRSILVCLVVLSVTLAGCSSGLPFGGGDDGSPGGSSVDLESKLGTSPDTVFDRVERLAGVNVSHPSLDVFDPDDVPGNGSDESDGSNLFFRTVVSPSNASTPAGAFVDAGVFYSQFDDTLYVTENTARNRSPAGLEAALAFGFILAIHQKKEWAPFPPNDFVDQAMLYGTTGSLYRAYESRYLDGSAGGFAPFESLGYENATTAEWYYRAPIYYGLQYADSRLQSPSGVSAFYRGDYPVTTMEGMLHGTSEGVTELPLDVDVSTYWKGVGSFGRQERDPEFPGDRLGELATRTILMAELDRTRAIEAAAGWANDRVTTLESFYANGTRGVVWTHAWDSPAQADEFERALRDFVRRRRADIGGISYEVRRLAKNVTVLLAGTDDFPALVETGYADGRVNIDAG